MINWEKAQWADQLKIYFKDGSTMLCKGNGISMAEDFDDPEDQYDTFFVINKGKHTALNIDEIQNIEFL
ncbi:hypothetical protein [Allofustis seminis]|uniref:hypothetical protein n=1 Tax=Allofustis seminis TaxID=166939 RepID=UPI00037B0529|nr:hypothetical protein [Allofustis seminis]